MKLSASMAKANDVLLAMLSYEPQGKPNQALPDYVLRTISTA
jgi:hypothetical protein